MKVLLLHPQDSFDAGSWANSRWDLIVDLGWSGRYFYDRLSQKYSTRVLSCYDTLDPEEHGSRLRALFAVGLGELVDGEGVDWWELFSPFSYSRLDEVLMMSALCRELEDDDVVATRSHFLVRMLSMLLGRKITCLENNVDGKGSASDLLQRYSRLALTFGPSQLAEIALDKWDSDFRLRRFFNRRNKRSPESVVLLPSSYVNVSRAQAEYAKLLPEQKFLQVITRRNGRIDGLPKNIEVRSLASYAPLPYRRSTDREYAELCEKWHQFEGAILGSNEELKAAKELGAFSGFPRFLRNGLRVRDAWLGVLERENVCSVLSADENNPYTRLPVLLAGTRRIATVLCDHGALNMTFALRQLCSELYLVRGEMARDYLVQKCGLRSERVVVGAASGAVDVRNSERIRDWIVIFSEAYELFSGRVEGFYREIFPPLCALARQTGRKVVLKLHPFESLRARRKVLKSALSEEDYQSVEVRGGPLTPELLERTWCGITVESSAACDCALQGIPCFLCNWFDASWYQYGKQFAKFDAGYLLSSPEEISKIPELIEQCRSSAETRLRLVRPIGNDKLKAMLLGKRAVGEGAQ